MRRRPDEFEPDQRRIECYRRSRDGIREPHEAEPDQPLEFSPIGGIVPWERVFRNADWIVTARSAHSSIRPTTAPPV